MFTFGSEQFPQLTEVDEDEANPPLPFPLPSSFGVVSMAEAYYDTPTLPPNATRMEEICIPAGYDPNKIYNTDYDRYWSSSSGSSSVLTQDPTCESKRSNPRYYYSSHLLPCNFTFHILSAADANKTGPNELTDLCSTENQMKEWDGTIAGPLQDFIRSWPDECVGDYQRCYSVADNQDIFASWFCQKHWIIPDEVTHIGVDCSADKQLKLQKIAEYDAAHQTSSTSSSSSSSSSSSIQQVNYTETQEMCMRHGYDIHRAYDISYSRSWSPSESGASYLEYDPGCVSARSNMRYYYTSHLSPCNFTFHTIPEGSDDIFGPNEVSNLCSKQNVFNGDGSTTVIQDFVNSWPDECVGDFQRCYSVEKDEAVYSSLFCKRHWEIPQGVTHIGVDCTLDKKEKVQAYQKAYPSHFEEKEREENVLTETQQMCSRLGYNLDRVYDASYESRNWWPGDNLGFHKNNQPCATKKSNARAKYTAHVSPCNFTFHRIPEGAKDTGTMELSDMCSSSNEVISTVSTTLEDYVQNWPYECVGDFQRCYHIEKHEKIFADLFCRKHWTIPEGATHIGVDCTGDKQSKLEQIEDYLEHKKEEKSTSGVRGNGDEQDSKLEDKLNYFAHQDQELREVETIAVAGFLFAALFCSVSMFCAFKKVLKPWLFREMEMRDPSLDRTSLSDSSFEMNSLVGEREVAEHNNSPRFAIPSSPLRQTTTPPRDNNLKYRLLDKA